MTTNRKRPSDLAVWDGDLSANLHVHKPGSSMKVSLQEIVDAVPASGSGGSSGGGSLEPGDIILKPTKNYTDFMLADGSIHASSVAPALAEKLANSTFYDLNFDSIYGYSFPELVVAGADYMTYSKVVAFFGDYLFYAGTSSSLRNALFNTKTGEYYDLPDSPTYTNMHRTKNTLHLVTNTGIWTLEGLKTGSPAMPSLTWNAKDADIAVIGSVGDDIDLAVGFAITNFRTIKTDTVELSTPTVPAMTVHQGTAAKNNKVYVTATIQNVRGLYELSYDQYLKRVDYRLIYNLDAANKCLGAQDSSAVYFGVNSLDFCYNIEDDSVTRMNMPYAWKVSTTARMFARDNFIFISDGVPGTYIYSFDYGKTWSAPAQLGHFIASASIRDTSLELLTRDATEDYAYAFKSIDFKGVAPDHFKLPLLKSANQEYSYYVKK